MNFLIQFISISFDLISFLVIARVLLSWFRPSRDNALVRFIIDTSEPILNLAKKITPRTGMIDFSPIIAILGLEILRYIILSTLASI